MKPLIALIPFLSIINCSSGQRNSEISGLYGECGIGFFSCTQIYLDTNGIFEYFIFNDVGGGKTVKGSWALKNDTLVLNTFNKPRQIDPVVLNSYEKENDSICIRVFDQDSTNLGLAQLIFNNLEFTCDVFGILKVPKQVIKQITVEYLTQSFKISFINTTFTDISIFVPFQNSTIPEYLVDEKWLVNRDKLIPYLRNEQGYDKKYFLRKINIDNKRF
jgi:hypothetical protein